MDDPERFHFPHTQWETHSTSTVSRADLTNTSLESPSLCRRKPFRSCMWSLHHQEETTAISYVYGDHLPMTKSAQPDPHSVQAERWNTSLRGKLRGRYPHLHIATNCTRSLLFLPTQYAYGDREVIPEFFEARCPPFSSRVKSTIAGRRGR